MKMLLVAIFALSCAQISNAVNSWSHNRHPSLSFRSGLLEEGFKTDPAMFDTACPIEEVKSCGFKYGKFATKKLFPYVAFLRTKNMKKTRFCSGTLFKPKWVLTTAYCILPECVVEVILGALVPLDDKDPDRVVVHSYTVFRHPDYVPDDRAPKNDVALILLPRDVRSDAVQPIPIKYDTNFYRERFANVSAWGEVGYETMTYTSDMLIFKGPCKCTLNDRLDDYGDPEKDTELFCCRTIAGLCFIHNGAGLVKDGGVIAVMSNRCYETCRDKRGTFTNLYKHKRWITNIITTIHPGNDTGGQPVYPACSDVPGITPGVFWIQPNKNRAPFQVYCEIRLDGEKWTVIQQRFDNSEDFYRNYVTYALGFGNLNGSHWLGLDKIHQLTNNGDHELYIQVRAHNMTRGYAQYKTFKVGSTETGFQLTVSGYWLGSGDSMNVENINLNGMKFTTYDVDQDLYDGGNCAIANTGAWWYRACSDSNLNGHYYPNAEHGWKGMVWVRDFGPYSLKMSRMMVRKRIT